MSGRRSVLLFAAKPDQEDAEMPNHELVAYTSVELKRGESKPVSFKVGFEELKYWSEQKKSWQMPKGEIKFSID